MFAPLHDLFPSMRRKSVVGDTIPWQRDLLNPAITDQSADIGRDAAEAGTEDLRNLFCGQRLRMQQKQSKHPACDAGNTVVLIVQRDTFNEPELVRCQSGLFMIRQWMSLSIQLISVISVNTEITEESSGLENRMSDFDAVRRTRLWKRVIIDQD